ncbi:uncharacterized protein LOC130668816 [Microplitis mediator]|uniref:uncharacterized protein LOC130668816 n=1 Tax=Microplitis mediator TaxID=375433 RepID=UPI002556A976|nr:uncharacterized protein LOC130668816 [Microplitis mediator]
MDLQVEKELKEAKSLLNKVSWVMGFLGAWPVQKSLFQRIKFTIFVIYKCLYLLMAFNGLVANFDNVKLLTVFVQQISGLSMTFNRILFINFSTNVKDIIIATQSEIRNIDKKDLSEKMIYIKIHRTAKIYFTLTISFVFFTAVSWYVLPLLRCFVAWLTHKPLVIVVPYKVKIFFFNVSSFERSFLLYISQIPTSLMQPTYVASINMQLVIVTNLCAQIAILSSKVRSLDLEKDSSSSNLILRDIVVRHVELYKLARKIENTWTPIYCLELAVLTPLISIIIYNAMILLSSGQKVTAIPYCTYMIVTLGSLFGHCLMGESLKNQCDLLSEAYYHCNWTDMPMINKKKLIICMTYTNITLHITAGKFFVYSYNAYTGMLKTIMAYVSLLRTVAM